MLEDDHFVYVKLSYKGSVILSLYVDDLLLAGNDNMMVIDTK